MREDKRITIQITEETWRKLNSLKRGHEETLDAVITRLIANSGDSPSEEKRRRIEDAVESTPEWAVLKNNQTFYEATFGPHSFIAQRQITKQGDLMDEWVFFINGDILSKVEGKRREIKARINEIKSEVIRRARS
jgi:predicted CopG family antitoxin